MTPAGTVACLPAHPAALAGCKSAHQGSPSISDTQMSPQLIEPLPGRLSNYSSLNMLLEYYLFLDSLDVKPHTPNKSVHLL